MILEIAIESSGDSLEYYEQWFRPEAPPSAELEDIKLELEGSVGSKRVTNERSFEEIADSITAIMARHGFEQVVPDKSIQRVESEDRPSPVWVVEEDPYGLAEDGS